MRISDWSSDVCSSDLKADTPPYGSVPQGQSQPIGFDIDIAHQIASRMKVKLNMVIVTSANRIANLKTKKVDILVSSLVHTRDRRSEEHTSELQSLMRISYAVFCLKKKKINRN